jgi:hypothetical protein
MEISMKHFIAACAAALLVAACQSDGKAADKTPEKPDPRQGKEVSQVCFNSQIRNWRENDRHSIIIEKDFKKEYKLDLGGTCQPQDAFLSIGLISHGASSCLSTMDKLVTDSRIPAGGPCFIQHIYEWNKDAGKPAPAGAATPAPG